MNPVFSSQTGIASPLQRPVLPAFGGGKKELAKTDAATDQLVQAHTLERRIAAFEKAVEDLASADERDKCILVQSADTASVVLNGAFYTFSKKRDLVGEDDQPGGIKFFSNTEMLNRDSWQLTSEEEARVQANGKLGRFRPKTLVPATELSYAEMTANSRLKRNQQPVKAIYSEARFNDNVSGLNYSDTIDTTFTSEEDLAEWATEKQKALAIRIRNAFKKLDDIVFTSGSLTDIMDPVMPEPELFGF